MIGYITYTVPSVALKVEGPFVAVVIDFSKHIQNPEEQ